MLSFYLTLIDNENDKMLFEKLYYAYSKQMFYVALSVLKNEADAEDAIHDVFCSIAEKHIHILQTIKCEADVRNYLLKATKNTAINILKKQRSTEDYVEDITFSDVERIYTDDEFFDLVCEELEYEKLLAAIRNLGEKYYEVLYLHYVIGLSATQMAKALSRSLDTVKKQIVRARAKLIENLEGSEVLVCNE